MVEDIERAVLGAVLVDQSTWPRIAVLNPKDFSLDAHRRIYTRMRALADLGHPIEILAVQAELEQHKELHFVAGGAYLGTLLDGAVPANVDYYVSLIQEHAHRRRFAKEAESALRLASDPTVSMSVLEQAASELSQMTICNEPLPPEFSEEALALQFSRRHGDDLRYVSQRSRWMYWDQVRWVEDHTLRVFDLARAICRAASAACGASQKAIALRLASKNTSAAIERLAEADRRHASTETQWDTNPWLLNTPIGTVDLRTGEVRDHRRTDYITKVTAASPGGDCPIWLRFLARITGGDMELQSFLQRIVGYTLTGITREHALFFLYGTGSNGKSVFLSTLSSVLADYAKVAPISSFTASSTEQHPTALAGLRGARFVTVVETETGAQWAEAKIKLLTGGEKVAARFMRADFFEYFPEFKLIIAGNHKPTLRSVDEAIRRRLHLVPFTVTIPESERDPLLTEKLRAEYSGILAWAIEGCLAWQTYGLNPPNVVRKATRDYLASEDIIGRWLEERCVNHDPAAADRTLWTPVSLLFANWQDWYRKMGEREGSQKQFVQQLEARGFERHRTNRAKGFIGLVLQNDRVPRVPGSPLSNVLRPHARASQTVECGTSGTEQESAQ